MSTFESLQQRLIAVNTERASIWTDTKEAYTLKQIDLGQRNNIYITLQKGE